jgi:hypothetical protein
MRQAESGSYDPETIDLLRSALDEAWASLTPDKQAHTSKTALAARILRLAAEGERDPVRLRTYALLEVVAAAE